MNHSALDIFFWAILPYFALGVFVVGHWWRYRRDQFQWTTRSTQILDRKVLGWASPMFHFGILAAAGGHIVGVVVPSSFTEFFGITEHQYHWFAIIMGGIAGVVTLVGFFGLLYRRMTSVRVRRTTTNIDLLAYGVLTAMIVLGCYLTLWNAVLADHAFNYRDTIGTWFRSVFAFNPDIDAALASPLTYQIHAILGWIFWAAFPFTRLVHVWSVPVAYIGRPYILYRRRYNTESARIR